MMAKILYMVLLICSASGMQIIKIPTPNVYPVIIDRSSDGNACPMYEKGYQFDPSSNSIAAVSIVNSWEPISRKMLLKNTGFRETFDMEASLADYVPARQLPKGAWKSVDSSTSSGSGAEGSRLENEYKPVKRVKKSWPFSLGSLFPSLKTLATNIGIEVMIEDEATVDEAIKCILRMPCDITENFKSLLENHGARAVLYGDCAPGESSEETSRNIAQFRETLKEKYPERYNRLYNRIKANPELYIQ